MRKVQHTYNITYVFVDHDLTVLKQKKRVNNFIYGIKYMSGNYDANILQ